MLGGMQVATARYLGDAAHVVNLLLIAVYAFVTIIHQSNDRSSSRHLHNERDVSHFSVDARWLEDGFCASQYRSIVETHHETAVAMMMLTFGYIILSALLPTFFTFLKPFSPWMYSSSANQRMRYAILAAFAHAISHFFLAFAIQDENYPEPNVRIIDDLVGHNVSYILKAVSPGYFIFWVILPKVYMMNTAWPKVAIYGFVGMIGAFFLPINYGPAYYQIFVYTSSCIDQLLFVPKSSKDFEYALWPILTTIPAICLGFLESFTCSSNALMIRYGHAFYDSITVVSYILFHLISAGRQSYIMKLVKKSI